MKHVKNVSVNVNVCTAYWSRLEGKSIGVAFECYTGHGAAVDAG